MMDEANSHSGRTAVEHNNEWTPLSAEQFLRFRFRETPMGRRGIRPDDVTAAMNRAAYELEKWRLRCESEQAENTRLREWFKRQRIDVDTPGPRQPADEATHLLIVAQREADQLITAARAQANHLYADALAQADAIIEQARRTRDEGVRQYRATAGTAYNADQEEFVRLRNWLARILSLLTTTETHLGVVAGELTRTLNMHTSGTMPDSPSGIWAADRPR